MKTVARGTGKKNYQCQLRKVRVSHLRHVEWCQMIQESTRVNIRLKF